MKANNLDIKSSRLVIGFVLAMLGLFVVSLSLSFFIPVTGTRESDTTEKALVWIKTKGDNGDNLIPKNRTASKVRLWQHNRTNLPLPSLDNTDWIHPDLWRDDLTPKYEDELLLRYADDWRFAITVYYATLGLVPEPHELMPLFPPEISTRLTHRFAAETEVMMRESLVRSRQWGEEQRKKLSARR